VESIRDGNKRDFAIIDAGIKRARPIVMTTIAMAAGMIAIRTGVRRRRRIPLADGTGRDRRPRVLHRAVAGVRAGDVHDDGRRRRIVWRFGKKLLVSSGEASTTTSIRRRGMAPSTNAANDRASPAGG